jgi:hypothetical protein
MLLKAFEAICRSTPSSFVGFFTLDVEVSELVLVLLGSNNSQIFLEFLLLQVLLG